MASGGAARELALFSAREPQKSVSARKKGLFSALNMEKYLSEHNLGVVDAWGCECLEGWFFF